MNSKQSLILSDTVIKVLFDRFEKSNERNATAIMEVTKAIDLLLKTVGKKPEEVVGTVRKLEAIIRDIENKVVETGKAEAEVVDNCKNIKLTLERIDRNVWKFYVVIGVVFTLGLTLLYLLIDLKAQMSALLP